jgi:flagellar biosynthesis GTPase FlhF
LEWKGLKDEDEKRMRDVAREEALKQLEEVLKQKEEAVKQKEALKQLEEVLKQKEEAVKQKEALMQKEEEFWRKRKEIRRKELQTQERSAALRSREGFIRSSTPPSFSTASPGVDAPASNAIYTNAYLSNSANTFASASPGISPSMPRSPLYHGPSNSDRSSSTSNWNTSNSKSRKHDRLGSEARSRRQ